MKTVGRLVLNISTICVFGISNAQEPNTPNPTAPGKGISPSKAVSAAQPAVPQMPADPEVLSAVVVISGEKAAGTGFFCKFRGKSYIATNQHVLGAGNRLTIRTSQGASVTVKQIFAATDADIALLECASIPPGVTELEVATLPDSGIQKDDQIIVPGNSKADGVITQTAGKLLAIGPQKIEVDNPVYGGNSGSPLLHVTSKKVIGVLTEAHLLSLNQFDKASFRSKNSAIKSEIRYFGHRIDSVQKWEPLNWNAFQMTESVLKQNRGDLEDIFAYFTDSSDRYKNYTKLHEARIAAAKIYYDPSSSNADKIAAFNRFLREIDFLARRAKSSLDSQKIYFFQKGEATTIVKMADAILKGSEIAKRDNDLVATLLDRGKK